MKLSYAVILLWASLGSSGAASAALPLTVCLLEHNPPYSNREANSGFDLATATAVAARLERPLEVIWVASTEKITEVEDSNFPVQRLRKGGCDVLFSIPGPARDSLRGMPTLTLGQPYYGAAFELYGKSGEQRHKLSDLHNSPVAIQAATVAAFALSLVGAQPRTFFSPAQALAALGKGEVELALLWGPTTSYQLAQHPAEGIGPVATYVPPAALAWNEHPATRAADASLRAALDAALAALVADGSLQKMATSNGLSLRVPFARTHSLGEMNNLR
ncbi:MAG: transporter substrate-binding domain-containing protein [Gammaproteobacteria bacterium]|nr:transporter substrate-binding domain-containing protein [Gammaproteobacteria bacterium]